MSRNGGGFTRDMSYASSPDESEPSWMGEYLDAVKKYSVKTKKEDMALFEQISQILGNSKSKYSSVEEAVLDMQKRTGLLEMLKKKASSQEPDLFEKIPGLQTFIDNHIKTFPGTSVDAVVFNLMKIPTFKSLLPSGEGVGEDVRHYINNKIKELSPADQDQGIADDHLGKLDTQLDIETMKNDSPLSSLNPTTF